MEHFEENAWIGTLTEQFVALALFCLRHIFVIGKELFNLLPHLCVDKPQITHSSGSTLQMTDETYILITSPVSLSNFASAQL